MRSYWMSLCLVAGVLLGYTAIVFTTHTPASKSASTSEPREPAAAAAQAAVSEAPENVN